MDYETLRDFLFQRIKELESHLEYAKKAQWAASEEVKRSFLAKDFSADDMLRSTEVALRYNFNLLCKIMNKTGSSLREREEFLADRLSIETLEFLGVPVKKRVLH